jgi:hypothetical protein
LTAYAEAGPRQRAFSGNVQRPQVAKGLPLRALSEAHGNTCCSVEMSRDVDDAMPTDERGLGDADAEPIRSLQHYPDG